MSDPEPLLLVDNRKPQILKVNVLGDKPVGADHNIDQSSLQLMHDLFLLAR